MPTWTREDGWTSSAYAESLRRKRAACPHSKTEQTQHFTTFTGYTRTTCVDCGEILIQENIPWDPQLDAELKARDESMNAELKLRDEIANKEFQCE